MVTEKKKTRQRKTRGTLRTEATRQALLDAAKGLFAEKGMDLTTIDDITERADVGKGTFYYHFKNKSGLVNEVMGRMLLDLRAAVDAKCRGAEGLEDLLNLLISAHLEFFNTQWEQFVLFFQGRADLTLKEGYEGIDTPFVQYLEHIAGLLDDYTGCHLGKHTLSRISCAVAGFVSGYYSFAVIAYDENELEETLRPVRKALVAGLIRFIKEAIPNDKAPVRW